MYNNYLKTLLPTTQADIIQYSHNEIINFGK